MGPTPPCSARVAVLGSVAISTWPNRLGPISNLTHEVSVHAVEAEAWDHVPNLITECAIRSIREWIHQGGSPAPGIELLWAERLWRCIHRGIPPDCGDKSILDKPLFPARDGGSRSLQPFLDSRVSQPLASIRISLARKTKPAGSERDCAISFRSARCCSDNLSGLAVKGT